MKPNFFGLAGAAALSGIAATQFSDYPTCADPCLNEYIPKTGCDLDDIPCRCYAEIAKPDIFNSIVSCLSRDCDLSDLEKAQDVASSLCESATATGTSTKTPATTAAAGTVTTVTVPTNTQEPSASTTTSSDFTLPTSDGGAGDSGDTGDSGDDGDSSSSSSSSGHTYTGKHGKHGSKLSTGGIAGIAVGVGLAGLFAVGLIAFWLWKRHARSKAMAQSLAAADRGAPYPYDNGKPELETSVTAQFPHSAPPSTVVPTPPPNQMNYGAPVAQVSPHEAYGAQIPSPATYHEPNSAQIPAAAPYYEADANQVPTTTHEMSAWQTYEMPSERH